MKKSFEAYLSDRKVWQTAFDLLLQFGSSGVLEKEILSAKEVFFSKLGRAHEMREELYENASQSFLEWYLFEYSTKVFGKSPIVAYLTLGQGENIYLQALNRSLFNHWSIFEIREVRKNELVAYDLLFSKVRKIIYDHDSPEAKLWRIRKGNFIQSRFFPLTNSPFYFFTHLWIHPKAEEAVLRKICRRRAPLWSGHKDFLLSAFEAVVRTHGLQSQISSSGSHNWIYQELIKRYA